MMQEEEEGAQGHKRGQTFVKWLDRLSMNLERGWEPAEHSRAGKERCSPTFREPGRRYSPSSPLSSQQIFADGSDDGTGKPVM